MVNDRHIVGFWLSRDPLGEYEGPNLYGYVANDPVNGFDPFGLACGASGPPPVPVPGSPNTPWKSGPGSGGREFKWSPQDPVGPPGSPQPSASYDPQGHWDVNQWDPLNQKTITKRYDDNGKFLTPEEAHGYRGPRTPWWELLFDIPEEIMIPILLVPVQDPNGKRCA